MAIDLIDIVLESESKPGLAPADAPIKIRVLDNETDWQAAAGLIEAVCEDAHAPVFVFPHWLHSAWCWRVPGARLKVVLATVKDECVGFAPLVTSARTAIGFQIRILQLVAVPDTQFVDLVARPALAYEFAAALSSHLHDARSDWDRLELANLSDRFGNWRLFAQALAGAGIAAVVIPAGANPFVDLRGSFADYYAARSRRLKKSINLGANRLAQMGRIEIEWVRNCSAADEALTEAIRVSSISWKKSTDTTLNQGGPRAFIERLTAGAAGRGQLSLWLLRLNGRVIATEYQLIHEGVVHALRADFDPAFGYASPGSYLNRHLLEQLFSAGLRRYCMGAGSNAYKRRWADGSEPMFQLLAYSPTWRGKLLHWCERSLLPLLRRSRPALGQGSKKAF